MSMLKLHVHAQRRHGHGHENMDISMDIYLQHEYGMDLGMQHEHGMELRHELGHAACTCPCLCSIDMQHIQVHTACHVHAARPCP